MGINFADFQPKNEPQKEKKKSSIGEDEIRQTYDSLKNLNSAELDEKLLEEVAKQKESGSFNYEMLSSSVESMRSFLPDETYYNLKELLRKIK